MKKLCETSAVLCGVLPCDADASSTLANIFILKLIAS